MMKTKLTLMLILVFVLSISLTAVAGEIGFANEEQTRDFCDSFLNFMVEGDIEKAFDMVENEWPFSISEIQNLESSTIKQLDSVKGRYGKVLGYELIKEEVIKDTFLKYTYVMKYERHIIRWKFIFYKPEGSWILNTFNFDDSINKLFND